MADGAAGRDGRCVPERTGADDAVGQTSERVDGAERLGTVGRTGVERVRTVERTGGRGADGAQHARTGRRADEQVA